MKKGQLLQKNKVDIDHDFIFHE